MHTKWNKSIIMINLVNLDSLNRDHRSIKLISMINKSLHFKDCPVVTIKGQSWAGVVCKAANTSDERFNYYKTK